MEGEITNEQRNPSATTVVCVNVSGSCLKEQRQCGVVWRQPAHRLSSEQLKKMPMF